MTIVRLDIVNVELPHHLGCEIREVHSRQTGVAVVGGWTFDVGAERVRGNGDAIPRCARKRYVGRGDNRLIGSTSSESVSHPLAIIPPAVRADSFSRNARRVSESIGLNLQVREYTRAVVLKENGEDDDETAPRRRDFYNVLTRSEWIASRLPLMNFLGISLMDTRLKRPAVAQLPVSLLRFTPRGDEVSAWLRLRS